MLTVKMPLLLVSTALFALCTPGCAESIAPAGSESLLVTINGEAMGLSEDSNLWVTLYGYDPSIADQSANIIAQEIVSPLELPYELEFGIPYQPEGLIDPGDPDAGAAMYYFVVHVDVDGDGSICEDEYIGDYDPDGPLHFTMGSVETIALDVKPQSAGECSDPPR